eukprot:gene24866-10768_t
MGMRDCSERFARSRQARFECAHVCLMESITVMRTGGG